MHHRRTSQRCGGQCENRDVAVSLRDRAGEHVGLPERRQHALAVLATKWFQGNISAKGRVVVMIRQSDIRTALVSLAGSTEVFQPTPPQRRLMQSRPLTQTATVERPKTFILCRLSGKAPAHASALLHTQSPERAVAGSDLRPPTTPTPAPGAMSIGLRGPRALAFRNRGGVKQPGSPWQYSPSPLDW